MIDGAVTYAEHDHPAARRGGDPVTDVRSPSRPHRVDGRTRTAEATRPFGQRGPAKRRAAPAAPSGPPATGAGWGRWAWRQLTSMRTALVLLFLLALGSVPGSVLPQQGSDPASVTQYFRRTRGSRRG